MDSGQLLREARRRAGLTQQQVADRAAVSQSLVARIESGRVASSFERLLGLVRACGFDLDIRVVPLDEDAWSMTEQGARLNPDERLDRAVAGVHLRREARLAAESDG
ncbi:MAG: helix-turn-helix transcriptional regulator [Actinomycetota bacterium]